MDSGLRLGKPFPRQTVKQRPAIYSVAVSPTSDVIAWGCRSGQLFLQHLVPGSEPIELRDGKAAHTKTISSIAFDPTAKIVASASHDGTVKFWDLTERKLVQTLKEHEGRVQAVRYAPDGRSIATAGEDGRCICWTNREFSMIHQLKGHAGKVWALAYSHDSKRLASGSQDNTIRIWSIAPRGRSCDQDRPSDRLTVTMESLSSSSSGTSRQSNFN